MKKRKKYEANCDILCKINQTPPQGRRNKMQYEMYIEGETDLEKKVTQERLETVYLLGTYGRAKAHVVEIGTHSIRIGFWESKIIYN